MALGALLYIDLNLGADQAARFLAPSGPWHQWLQGTPSGSVSRRHGRVRRGTSPTATDGPPHRVL
ncbi:DUF6000 family protein [Streptomyces sp. NPDC085866]|uniref:DUF6000 family protein n=1 Tax=Streptomyces sp. NPDC085866 TaxID=3365736 RepID=UPI0037CD0454